MPDSKPNLRTLLWRGLRRRCPHCGEGRLFKRWITLHDRCSACDWQFLENQGDLWGYLLLIDRALFIFPLIVVIYFRVYNPYSPWFYGMVGGLLGGFLFTLPHRNGVSVALDYYWRTRGPLHSENQPPQA